MSFFLYTPYKCQKQTLYLELEVTYFCLLTLSDQARLSCLWESNVVMSQTEQTQSISKDDLDMTGSPRRQHLLMDFMINSFMLHSEV